MPVTLTFPYSQAAGVGRGYFVAADAPGAAGIVTVASTTGDVELRITRYNAPDFVTTVTSGTTFSVSIGNIQTIGILALQTATGTLSLITNV
ncbi:hypothetical protein P4H42_31795 [Paenibacillus macerans]|uniref:hypothetical protein n=1 Tax=Paenibacillus macerans TaxID=44252 RepID=UPI002430B5FA|nr:hypothetical protein [Paenibacillus macerans]MBS5913246.1 hypothetical protein [Paenibacillus macerans]MDU5949452.1 hypothetical protein [Paenibacillus macerans]MEC0334151.1 hypothetical protein [Paenibacillus macerans]